MALKPYTTPPVMKVGSCRTIFDIVTRCYRHRTPALLLAMEGCFEAEGPKRLRYELILERQTPFL